MFEEKQRPSKFSQRIQSRIWRIIQSFMLNHLHPDISILEISIVPYFHDLNEWFTSIRRNKKLVSLMVFQVWNNLDFSKIVVRCDCFFFPTYKQPTELFLDIQG